MPEFIFTCNVNFNINCDPKLLSFLETLQQRIKPVELQEKIVSIPSTTSEEKIKKQSGFSNLVKFSDSLKKVTENYQKDKKVKHVEELKENLIKWIGINQPCTIQLNPETKTFYNDFRTFVNCKDSSKIRKCLMELEKEGKIIRARTKQDGGGRVPYIYSVKGSKKATDIRKFTSKESIENCFEDEEKVKEEKKFFSCNKCGYTSCIGSDFFTSKEFKGHRCSECVEEEEEEDMMRADNVIEVPSLERSPRREIKLKCLKCGGQLWKKNPAEDNYMDAELRFLDLPGETCYQCLSCGRIFKEKEVKKEAIAA